MPVSIYTNRGSHQTKYLPTEQADPFAAYAAMGAQQQERTDKYRDELAKIMPDLSGIEEDTEAVRSYQEQFKTKMDAAQKGFENNNIPEVVKSIGELNRMKTIQQGTPEWGIKKRAEQRQDS